MSHFFQGWQYNRSSPCKAISHPHARLVAVVHAETSTGVEHPLEHLGLAIHQSGHRALLMADCVTSLGGIELDFARAELDYAYSCTQKCLGAPPGWPRSRSRPALVSGCRAARTSRRSAST